MIFVSHYIISLLLNIAWLVQFFSSFFPKLPYIVRIVGWKKHILLNKQLYYMCALYNVFSNLNYLHVLTYVSMTKAIENLISNILVGILEMIFWLLSNISGRKTIENSRDNLPSQWNRFIDVFHTTTLQKKCYNKPRKLDKLSRHHNKSKLYKK